MDVVALVVERPGEQPGGRRLAHPAHAGQHEGMGDAAGGEGVGQRPDHAPPGRSGRRRSSAGTCAREPGSRPPPRRRPRRRTCQASPCPARASVDRFGVRMVVHSASGAAGWRLDGDPERNSLRLLPSGPDRVGEDSARRQPPRRNIAAGGGRKGGSECLSAQAWRCTFPPARAAGFAKQPGCLSTPSRTPSPAIRSTGRATSGRTPTGSKGKIADPDTLAVALWNGKPMVEDAPGGDQRPAHRLRADGPGPRDRRRRRADAVHGPLEGDGGLRHRPRERHRPGRGAAARASGGSRTCARAPCACRPAMRPSAPRPRACSNGAAGTASAPPAASRPSPSTAAGSGSARAAAPSTSRAPIRW